MGRVDLDAALAREQRARGELAAVCKEGGRRWRMSIPAQPERDTDLLLAASLADVPALAGELRAARFVVEAGRAVLAMPQAPDHTSADRCSAARAILYATITRYDTQAVGPP